MSGRASGRRADSTSDSGGASGGTNVYSDLGLVVAAIVVTPWVFMVSDRHAVAEFDVDGVDWVRACWLVPLVYGGLAAVTYFVYPQHLHMFWIGHLLLAVDAVLLLIQTQWPAVPLEALFGPRLSTLRLVGVGATAVAVVCVGWLLTHGERLYAYVRTVTPGEYLLPFTSVTDQSDRMGVRRAMSLVKDRSILVLGETGAGKTETIKLLTHQLQTDPDEPFVVFDYKGEYQEFLEADGPDDREVIYLSSTDATHYWNLFEELEREADIDEVANAMFPRTDGTEFFSAAARQLFVAVVTYLRRQAEWEGTTPTNADLVTFVQTMDREEMHDRLSEHTDLTAAASAIDPDAERQAAGVYANFQQQIADLFREDFAEAGEFSIREYMQNPDGRTLVLDFPIREGDAVEPAFRFFIDWAARFALTDDRGSYFVLDEFARLPGLRKVGDLVNAGRSYDTQLILGVQSVAQLYDTYGQDLAAALLSGLVQTIAMRVGDGPSIEYVRSQLGREQQLRTVPAHDRRGRSVGRQEVQSETYPVAESEVTRLRDGEVFVITPEGWVRGQLDELSDVRWELEQALDSES